MTNSQTNSKLTVFLELRSRKTVRFSEQIMSADKCPCIVLRQMETIVYILISYTNNTRDLAVGGLSTRLVLYLMTFHCSGLKNSEK